MSHTISRRECLISAIMLCRISGEIVNMLLFSGEGGGRKAQT